MVNEIRSIKLRELNKRFSSVFCVGSLFQHETPKEGWRTYRLKRCDNSNEDEDNSPNNLSDKK